MRNDKDSRHSSPSEISEQQKLLAIKERNITWMIEREKKSEPPIWTMDIETDPFESGHTPVPFMVGLFNGLSHYLFEGADCIRKARDFLYALPDEDRGIVYMHNGGRFDFFYMLDWFEGKSTIVNSRIIKAVMPIEEPKVKRSRHRKYHNQIEFRDSYAIMPFPLKAYDKIDIDIQKLAKENRNEHLPEIRTYLERDCSSLWELCMEFHREFGDYLTIASASFAQLTRRHAFDTYPVSQDKEIRTLFYYGGRVQCFRKGVVEQRCAIYDTNSMYPSVMQDFEHPVTWCSLVDTVVRWSPKLVNGKDFKTFFISVEGKNHGAFPLRLPDGSITFEKPDGLFHVTIHEWLAALELGLFKPTKILATYNFTRWGNFRTFVQDFYNARKVAKESNDAIHSLFYKFILNSAYGKFAINPENYYNWRITRDATEPKKVKGKEWELDTFKEGCFYIWKQTGNIGGWSYKNVATGASITGAARSVLLRAIAGSQGVLYCDTDSIICSKFGGGAIDPIKLGAWKCEAIGDRAAIAGKKMYAVFDGGDCIKQANKGVVLTPDEIVAVCRGENIFSIRDAPTFQRDGSAKFVTRKVRMT